ncbi:hypothetical protein [Psychromicrobium sp. YIM B11713]|uniref:hypothetical protein n=1 Tax=Psychromicrobium sp. YIM B11713 TaxID=3145233 RepID=UPI00374F3C49
MTRWLGLIIVMATLLLPLNQASAVATGWKLGAGLGSTELWVGQQKNSGGLLVYCTDFEKLSPQSSDVYTDGHQGPFIRSNGSKLSEQQNYALSYLLDRWGSTQDNSTAAAVQLSVWALTAVKRGWDTPGMMQIVQRAKLPSQVVSLGRSITMQALRFAGPYRIVVSFPRPGTALVSTLGPSGAQVPGLGVQLSTSGSLKLSGGPASWVSGEQSRFVPVQRTGFSPGTLSAQISRAPAPAVHWLQPNTAKKQRLISGAEHSPVRGSGELSTLSMRPKVRTETSARILTTPGQLKDVLTVSTDQQSPWLLDPITGKPVRLTVVSTLWGPFNSIPRESAAVPSGARAQGSVLTSVSAPGRYETPELPIKQPGYYVWTERIDSTSAVPTGASAYVKPWQSGFGASQETTLLRWRPSITTELSRHTGLPGDRVTDTVKVQGAPPAALGTLLTLSMYGPLTDVTGQSAAVPPGAAVHRRITVPLAEAKSIDFGPLKEVGCYTVVASIPGSTEVLAFQSAFGEANETICLKQPSPPKTTPTQPGPAAPTVTKPSAPAKLPHSVGRGPAQHAATGPRLVADKQLAATGTPIPWLPAGLAAGLVMLGAGCLIYAQKSRRSRRP